MCLRKNFTCTFQMFIFNKYCTCMTVYLPNFTAVNLRTCKPLVVKFSEKHSASAYKTSHHLILFGEILGSTCVMPFQVTYDYKLFITPWCSNTKNVPTDSVKVRYLTPCLRVLRESFGTNWQYEVQTICTCMSFVDLLSNKNEKTQGDFVLRFFKWEFYMALIGTAWDACM